MRPAATCASARRSARSAAAAAAFRVELDGEVLEADAVISTLATRLTARLVPELPQAWRARHEWGRAFGAHCLVLALDRPLTDAYWINVNQPGFPFLALVEHTNYMDPADYGGRHLVYLGNYRPMDDPIFSASKDELLAQFLPHLAAFNPAFDPSWVTDSWSFAAPFAQPIVTTDYREHIPPFRDAGARPVRGEHVPGLPARPGAELLHRPRAAPGGLAGAPSPARAANITLKCMSEYQIRSTRRPAPSSIARTSGGRYSLWNGSSPGQVLDRKRSFQIMEWQGTEPSSRPPGLRTRRISLRAVSGYGTCSRTSVQTTVANERVLEGHGLDVALHGHLLREPFAHQREVARVHVEAHAAGRAAMRGSGRSRSRRRAWAPRRGTWPAGGAPSSGGCDGRTPRVRAGDRRRRPSRRSRCRGSSRGPTPPTRSRWGSRRACARVAAWSWLCITSPWPSRR